MNISLQHTATLDLIHKRNDSIDYTFEILDKDLQPVNFSGYTGAVMSIKVNEFTDPVVTFSSTGVTYQIDMTNKAIGKIRIIANDTTALNAGTLYDLQLFNATKRETIIQGQITITPDIS